MPKRSLQVTTTLRHLAVLLLCAWLGVGQAVAGSMTLLGVGGAAAGAPAFSLTFKALAQSGSAGPTIDFGTQTYGSGCTRVVVASAWFVAATSITGITIGGTALAQIPSAHVTANSQISVDVWESSAALAGTSGDIQVTYNTTISSSANSTIGVYCLVTTTPAASAANTGTQANGTTASAAITVPAGGGGLFVTLTQNNTAITSVTNGAIDGSAAGGWIQSYGHITATGSTTVTTNTATNDGMAIGVVSWAP